jgi:hypothetical protein
VQVNSNILDQLPMAERFDRCSAAHLESARVLCQRLIDNPSTQTWEMAMVCMSETRHAVELFLKGAILKADPAAQPSVHDLATLGAMYHKLHPAPDRKLTIPFTTQVVVQGGGPVDSAAVRKHDKANPIDQRLRYPANRDFEPWPGIHACDPETFLTIIERLEQQMASARQSIYLTE